MSKTQAELDERQRRASQRIADAKASGARRLDLGDLALERLPAALGGLHELEVLSLGRYAFTEMGGLNDDGRRQQATFSDLSPLSQLTRLTALDLSYCPMLENLEALKPLDHLTTLSLQACTKVKELAPLERLSQLSRLYLGGCSGITRLDPLHALVEMDELYLGGCTGVNDLTALKAMTGTRRLHLEGCTGVTDLEPLQSLKHLTKLSLEGCTGVKKLSPLQHLPSLTTLDLANCTSVTDNDLAAVGSIKTLKELYLAICTGVSELGPLTALGQLDQLDLAFCTAVKDLGSLKSLRHLTMLSLGGCTGVSDLAPIGYLERLTELYLSGCTGIADLGPLASLRRLRELYLTGCAGVTQDALVRFALADQRRAPSCLETLSVRGTKAHLPEDLVRDCQAPAILRHLLSKARRRLSEAKVMLVGAGRAGKSHLLERLFSPKPEDRAHYDPDKKSTHEFATRLASTATGKLTLRAWDFGGQEHLHGSHRFFLGADHAVYVLVLDGTRSAAANRLNYWLRFAAHYGRGTQDGEWAPVIIVVNKCDLLSLAHSAAGKHWARGREIIAQHQELLDGLHKARQNRWFGAHVLGEPITGLGLFAHRTWRMDESLSSFPADPEQFLPALAERHHAALADIDGRLEQAFDVVPGVANEYEPGFHELKGWLQREFGGARPDGDTSRLSMLSTKGAKWRAAIDGLSQAGDWKPWLKTLRSLGVIHWVSEFDGIAAEHQAIEHAIFNPEWVKKPIYQLVKPQHDHERGKLTARQFQKRLAGLSRREFQSVRGLALACRVAYPIIDPKTGQARGEMLIPDLLESYDTPAETVGDALRRTYERYDWPFQGAAAKVLRKRVRLPFVSDRCLLRFVGTHYHEVDSPPKTSCWRDRIILSSSKSFHPCAVMVQSNLDPNDGSEPYLSVTVGGRDRTECDIIMHQVLLQLEQTIRDEKLIEFDDPLTIELDEAVAATSGPQGPLERLRTFVERHGHESWVEERYAHQTHNMANRAIELDTFQKYRKRDAKLTTEHEDLGVSKHGYVWKKANGKYLYLVNTLHSPYGDVDDTAR